MIKSRQLSFMAACDLGNRLIAIDEWGSGIFQIDKKDMSSHFLAMLEKQKYYRKLYQGAELFNNTVFFFPYPFAGREITVYHLLSQRVEYIDLQKMNSLIQGDYRPVQRVDNIVWLFPTDFSREVILFHLETRKVEMLTSWKTFMQEIELGYTDDWAKVGKMIEVENTLYYPVKGTNYIIEMDKSSYRMERHILPMDVKLHVSMDYDGQKLWIPELNCERMIAWNPKTDNINYYPLTSTSDELQKNGINRVLCGTRYLWIIPNNANRLMRMDYETGNYVFIDIFPQEFNYSKEHAGNMFHTIIKNGNVADIYPFTANMVIHLDLENDILLEQHEQILLPKEWSDQDILDYQLQEDNECELERVSVRVSTEGCMNFFFQSIQDSKKKNQSCNNGKNIWHQVSGE